MLAREEVDWAMRVRRGEAYAHGQRDADGGYGVCGHRRRWP